MTTLFPALACPRLLLIQLQRVLLRNALVLTTALALVRYLSWLPPPTPISTDPASPMNVNPYSAMEASQEPNFEPSDDELSNFDKKLSSMGTDSSAPTHVRAQSHPGMTSTTILCQRRGTTLLR